LTAAVALAYANSLSGQFIVDDVDTIVDNPSIRDWTHLRAVLVPEPESTLAGRPLVSLSFALNYALGGQQGVGYHLVNVAVHVAATLVLFGFLRRWLDLPRWRACVGPHATRLALGIALLWGVHPLNTEAVDYLTQRTESLMGLFYLATLYASLRALDRPTWQWTSVAIGCGAAGMACKESMVTAPVMVLLIDRVFVFETVIEAVRTRWRLYLGLAATWLVLAALVASGPRVNSAGFSSGVDVWTYLLNQTVMIVRYLRLAVWPTALVVNYGWPLPLTLRDVLPEASLVVALFVATMLALWRAPVWGGCGAWVFLTLAPTTSIVPIATEVGAERRMYLPLVGIVTLAVCATVALWRRVARHQARHPAEAMDGALVGGAAVFVFASALILGTIERNRDYRSGLILAETTVARWPSSVGEHVLGTELEKVGRTSEAIEHLRRAVPGAPRAYYSLGEIEFRAGQWDRAIRDFEAFLQAQPLLLEAVTARLRLGHALMAQGRWRQAVEQYRTVLTMHPSTDEVLDAQLSTGDALRYQGEYDAALPHYEAYMHARPDDVRGANGLAITLVGLHRAAEAATWFRRAADRNPDDGNLQRNAAMALLDVHLVAEAAPYAERAARLRPTDPGSQDVLGQIFFFQRRFAEAVAQFQIALQLNSTDAEIRTHLEHGREMAKRCAPRSATPQRC